jgi:indole-3-glycerol phosphate synthase
MTILDNIAASKKREIALKKTVVPISYLENRMLFNSKTISLSKSIRNNPFGIIAEHKRRSPSKSNINSNLSVEEVVKGYQYAGASAISVLTDTHYFGGCLDDLLLTKASVQIPVLRKEFIIDEYQIMEAKAHGADAVLLIAAILNSQEIKTLSTFAQSIALEVIVEIHNLEELEISMHPNISMIGVNNRNLKTFEVNLESSFSLASKIPREFVAVSESGISTVQDIKLLKDHGYQGFLIGETFMKTENPGKSLELFINELK